jgi:hypothetical protein
MTSEPMTSRLPGLTRPVAFVLLVSAGLAAVVRLVAVLPGPLTPGDGGLIVVFVDDLRNAGLVMPAVTTYNDLGIPFVYPPLGLYATAVLAELFGLSSLEGVRVVAGLLSLATLGTFALLALRLLPSVAAAGAVFMYALMPHAYDPIVAGGGVTRGAGVLLAMLAMWLAAGPGTPNLRRTIGVGVLIGLAALAQPQTALYSAVASTVLIYRSGDASPLAATARRVLVMGVTSFLVVLPWLIVMASTHGLGVVLAPGYRWDPVLGVIRLLGLTFSGAGFTDVFLVVGVLGLAVEIVRRRWRLPLLLAGLIFAGEADFIAAVPWCLLGGAAFAFVLEGIGPLVARRDRYVRLTVALVVVFAAFVASIGSVVDETSRLQRVSDDQAAAMEWVRVEVEPETRFIVAAVVAWGGDEVSEWFPAVAGRQSVATVQGSEWLGRDSFQAQRDRHREVLHCTPRTDQCMAEWAASAGLADAWLFVPKGQMNGPLSPGDCCPALRQTVQDSTNYEVVYDGPGATIARPRD